VVRQILEARRVRAGEVTPCVARRLHGGVRGHRGKSRPTFYDAETLLLSGFATGTLALLQLFALMWSSPDVIGLFPNNVGPFSRNVVLSGPSFSINLVQKLRMFLGQAIYVLGPLHLVMTRGTNIPASRILA
jgi:hypothetical protein